MSSVPLPPELWLIVFERIAQSLAHRMDAGRLRSRRDTNDMLLKCALVCRAWGALAQQALFRHVQLGTRVSVHPEVGSTCESLQLFIDVLARNDRLPGVVRSLHLGVGVETRLGDAYLQYVRHGPLADFMRVIALCPQLDLLDVLVGADLERNEWPISPDATASLARLRTLKIDNDHNASTCRLSSSLVTLHVRVYAEDEIFEELPELPCLEHVVCILPSSEGRSTTASLRAALRNRAPALRKAGVEAVSQDIIAALPSCITHLLLQTSLGADALDGCLSRFPALLRLEVNTGNSASLLKLLESVPSTLQSLTVPNFALYSPDDARALENTLLRLPDLQALTIIRASPAADFVIPSLSLDVRVSIVDEFDAPQPSEPSP